MPLARFAKSSALRSAFAFAIGGGGFALANVILAREMAPKDYGIVVLFVALTQLGATLGSAGMDTVALRHRIGPSADLFIRVLATSAALGGIAALALIGLFDISVQLSCLMIVAVVLSALNRLGCSFLQSLQLYRRGLGVMLAHNAVLLAATLASLTLQSFRIDSIAFMLTVGYAITTAYGWSVGRRQLKAHVLRESLRSYGREGFSIVTSQLSVALLNQLDRLLIPRLMSAGALGEYAAAATLCASPFNLLQAGARYTLLPRMKNCRTRDEAFRILRSEALAIFSMAILACAACLLLAPAVGQWLFEGRYTLEQDLLEILVVLGFLKVWESFAGGCVQALGTRKSLSLLSKAGWLALVIAFAGAVVSDEMDLTSIAAAIAAGWFTLCVAATVIAAQAAFSSPRTLPDTILPEGGQSVRQSAIE